MAEFRPQSLNSVTRFGAIKATVTKPYSDGDRNLVRSMVPTVDMTVQVVSP